MSKKKGYADTLIEKIKKQNQDFLRFIKKIKEQDETKTTSIEEKLKELDEKQNKSEN